MSKNRINTTHLLVYMKSTHRFFQPLSTPSTRLLRPDRRSETAYPTKKVANHIDSDIMKTPSPREESKVATIRPLGKIKIDVIEKEFGTIQTDEIVVTNEREKHIKARHPEDYELFQKYGANTVNNPDFIIKDGKNQSTIFMVRKLPDTNLNVVVKVALDTDEEGLKNSVMTFYRLRERNLKKLIEKNSTLIGKNSILYKRE